MTGLTLDEKIFYAAQELSEELKSVSDEDALQRVLVESKRLRALIAGFDEPLLIQVAGNIGFGKTTVAEIISNQTGMGLVLEDENDFFLKRYYDDMQLYSERLQLHLLSKRFHELVIKQSTSRSSLVCDRSPYEDPLVFARVLHETDQMTKDALENVFWYFEHLLPQLKNSYADAKLTPDILIHVYGDRETGWQRVQQRNRSMEMRPDAGKGKGLSPEFYAALQDRYANHFIRELRERHWYEGPVLPLNQSQVDVSDAKKAKGWLYIVSSLRTSLEIMNGSGR
jgi:deoxyadenosine/deoxycytidine kinase